MRKLVLLFLIFSTTIFAKVGNVTLLEGEAFLKRENLTTKLNFGDEIRNGDFIETKINSKVRVTFIDNTLVTIGKESSLSIDDYFFENENQTNTKANFSVAKGAFHTITGQIAKANPSKFKLKTKNANIGIRGTEIYADQDNIFCTDGVIFVESFGITKDVPNGYFITVYNNQAPSEVKPYEQDIFNDVDSKLNVNSIRKINNQSNSSDSSNFILAKDLSTIDNYDNLNSWDYWETSIHDEQNRINSDITTNMSYVQNLINSPTITSLTFNGSISNHGVEDVHTNVLQLNFLFGGSNNTLNGNLVFINSANVNLNIDFLGSITNSLSFTANGTSAIPGMSVDAALDGNFFGNNLNQVAGSINIDRLDQTATFSATR